jgi:cystathionine beta-lyase
MRAAYTTGETWLEDFLKYLNKNRSLLIDYVHNELTGIDLYPPEGTFLAWLDCSKTQLENPAEHFLYNAKVALNSGDWFGNHFMEFVRLNFACRQDTLISALERMKKSLIS